MYVFIQVNNSKQLPSWPSRAEGRAGIGADRNRSDDTLSLKISCRNAARTIRGGDFSTLWRLCIESPSQPKLASSLHNKRLSYWRLTGFGRNDGGRGPAFFIICGEAATTTLGAKGPVKLKNPPAHRGRSILRTFSHHAEPFEPFPLIMYNKAIIAKVLV